MYLKMYVCTEKKHNLDIYDNIVQIMAPKSNSNNTRMKTKFIQ